MAVFFGFATANGGVINGVDLTHNHSHIKIRHVHFVGIINSDITKTFKQFNSLVGSRILSRGNRIAGYLRFLTAGFTNLLSTFFNDFGPWTHGFTGFLFGWIFYLPLFVIGFPLEVLLTVGAVNLIYQFWVHTQMIRRLGIMDRIMVTPSNHRVHHAQNAPYIDKNYGGMLILWDRLFGTFEAERDDEPVVFGIRKPLANWNPFWANLQVYDYLLYDSIRTRRWRDKIGVWFRRTGWRPADMEAAHPKQQSNLLDFQKFDPDIGQGMQRYVLFQFLAAISLGLLITNVYIGGGLRAIAALCVMLWAHLYAIGLLNQGRPNAFPFEAFRLVVINGVALFAIQYSEFAVAPAGWVWIGIYTFVSMLWIIKLKTHVKTIPSTA